MFDLAEWKRLHMEEAFSFDILSQKGRDDVTVVAYVFGTKEKMSKYVDSIEFALRETYRLCGLLKTTLIVNQMTERLEYLQSIIGKDF